MIGFVTRFIPPALPQLSKSPPIGNGWLHEVKFDGYRVQLHKGPDGSFVYSKNGNDFGSRFRAIKEALTFLRARSAIIDGEIVACDEQDRPDFSALLFNRAKVLAVWCFDLLELDGKDMRQVPLLKRKEKLSKLVGGMPYLRYADHFADAAKLLAACEEHRLEGIVSKRADAPYRSGIRGGWIKVKCQSWREANKDRGELFAAAK